VGVEAGGRLRHHFSDADAAGSSLFAKDRDSEEHRLVIEVM
jgi:hypothetical protein